MVSSSERKGERERKSFQRRRWGGSKVGGVTRPRGVVEVVFVTGLVVLVVVCVSRVFSLCLEGYRFPPPLARGASGGGV